MNLPFAARRLALLVACAIPAVAGAFTATIAPGAKEIYLRVGAGANSGLYTAGGSGNNVGTVSKAVTSVSAANLGQGPVGMSPVNADPQSYYDGAVLCNSASEIYVGGYYRAPAGSGTATLSVTSPASLTSGGDALSFGTISWTASPLAARGAGAKTIADGAFVPGTQQTLRAVASNSYFEDCLAFSYANSSPLVRAGTYTGRVTYTLQVP